MGHRTTPLAAAITSGLITLALAPTAGAQPTTPTTGDGTAQQPVVVVMDYSESMLEADADEAGTTRIQAAKDATKDLIAKTPENARLGMIAFGHADRQTCTTIETLQKVDTIDKDALLAKVDALNAQGGTPIGQSLSRAADELRGIEGEKSIILVSDGEPTCDEPPACEVAQDLADQGIDLTVHTIGFRLSGNAKAQETLECIANATGGTYTPAEDAAQLTETLTTQTTRALQGYQASGTPVTGGARYEEATLLLPGQYRDTLTSHGRNEDLPALNGSRFDRGDVKFYRIPLRQGYLPVLTATLATGVEQAASEGSSLVAIEPVAAPGNNNCYPYRKDGTGDMADARGVPSATFSDRLWVQRAFEDESLRAKCLSAEGDLVVAVYQETDLPTDAPTDLELLLAYEPQRDPEGSPAPESKDLRAPAPTKATPVTGGGSFNDAVTLTDGQTISDSLVPGEERYYTIEAGVNQDVLTRLDFPQSDENVVTVMAHLYNPLREPMILSSGQERYHSGFALGTVHPRAGQTVFNHTKVPIHPNRRLDYVNVLEGDTISVAGRQYVVVSRAYKADVPATPLPFELTVATSGASDGPGPEHITTAAQFVERFGQPGSGPAPETAQPSAEAPAADASGSAAGEAAEEGAGRAAGDTATAEAAADTDAAGGAPTWALVLGGIGLLALGGGVAALTLGRRH